MDGIDLYRFVFSALAVLGEMGLLDSGSREAYSRFRKSLGAS